MILLAVISAYFWWWPMLAEASPDMVSVSALIKLLPVFFAGVALLIGKMWGKRDAQKVQIDQPFRVMLEENFVTRRELAEQKADRDKEIAEIKANQAQGMAEIKGMFGQTFQKIELQNGSLTGKMERQYERLTESIEKVIKEDRLGRVAIWEKVNLNAERITSVVATSDVAHQISKLADAISKPKHT